MLLSLSLYQHFADHHRYKLRSILNFAPKHFWHEFSSPFTDMPDEEPDESEETTTQDPYPFFEEAITSINVTTQLGNHVNLHCKVNDLREKTVSDGNPTLL
jgi:hypothetical protein